MAANDLRTAFDRADILVDTHDVAWSHTYLPFWWQLRNRYIELIRSLMDWIGYDEWNFSDLISESDMAVMNGKVMDISGKVLYTWHKEDKERLTLAPTHEVPITRMLQKRVEFEADLPIRLYHTWSAYRKPKQVQFPFNLGERRSFVEAHWVFPNSSPIEAEIERVQRMIDELIRERLIVPAVTSDRPLATNNPISKKTVCTDIITPFWKTQIAWMIYFHDDIFSWPFDLRFKSPKDWHKIAHTPSVLHFGFSDNLLLWTIVNGFNDNRFLLPNDLLPYQLAVILESESGQIPEWLSSISWVKIIYAKNKGHVKKVYDKLYLQWIPLIWRIRWDKLNILMADTRERFEWVETEWIWNLFIKAKKERDTLLKIKRDEKEAETVKMHSFDLAELNDLISNWKVVLVPLVKLDSNVIALEKNLNAWEVLGFMEDSTEGICPITWINTKTKAYISRRF